jgi:hypothetical protein
MVKTENLPEKNPPAVARISRQPSAGCLFIGGLFFTSFNYELWKVSQSVQRWSTAS